jgi:hypothetical protein
MPHTLTVRRRPRLVWMQSRGGGYTVALEERQHRLRAIAAAHRTVARPHSGRQRQHRHVPGTAPRTKDCRRRVAPRHAHQHRSERRVNVDETDGLG